MSAKFDIYEAVTSKVLDALENDIVPWRRPWSVKGNGFGSLHANLASKRVYRGINQFLLEIAAITKGYSSPYWMTYKAAKEKGGQVRKGEKSELVVFWKQTSYSPKAGMRCGKCHQGEYTANLVCDQCGERAPDKLNSLLLRHYNVFNIEQIDGIEAPESEESGEDLTIFQGEMILKDMPQRPKTSHGGDRAFYRPSTDSVRLPGLNRKGALGNSKGDSKYAREELVAEMGAAMLCGRASIDPDVTNTAAYVRSWLTKADYESALKDDKKLVIIAAAQAQKAADWIAGDLLPEDEAHEG